MTPFTGTIERVRMAADVADHFDLSVTDHVQVRKVRVSRWTLWRIRECARYIGQRAVNDEGIARDPVLGARVEVWGNGTVVLV